MRLPARSDQSFNISQPSSRPKSQRPYSNFSRLQPAHFHLRRLQHLQALRRQQQRNERDRLLSVRQRSQIQQGPETARQGREEAVPWLADASLPRQNSQYRYQVPAGVPQDG